MLAAPLVVIVIIAELLLEYEAKAASLVGGTACDAVQARPYPTARGVLEAPTAEDDPRCRGGGGRFGGGAGGLHAHPLPEVRVPDVEARHVRCGLHHEQARVHVLLQKLNKWEGGERDQREGRMFHWLVGRLVCPREQVRMDPS